MLEHRQDQLNERDVRRLAPANDPVSFLRMYVESNFPQTVFMPSADQQRGLVPLEGPKDELKLAKKPPSGTGYDRPGSY